MSSVPTSENTDTNNNPIIDTAKFVAVETAKAALIGVAQVTVGAGVLVGAGYIGEKIRNRKANHNEN